VAANPYESPQSVSESVPPVSSASRLTSLSAPRDVTVRELVTVWVVWWVYGAFYFCRNNLSAAVDGMQKSFAEGGLGLTALQTGSILASIKLTYGVGQLVNGQLAEHISPRRLLAVGMLVSAGLNVVFGLSAGFYFLVLVWATNGYFQSLGWTPCVRVVGNWVPVQRRGKAMGIIGTGYQVTQGLTYLVAGYSAQYLGWRGALYVPAGILVASAIFMLVFLADAPESRRPSSVRHREGTVAGPRESMVQTLLLTLSNPALWLLGISLGLLNACRYGYIDWGLSHLKEVQSTGVGIAALKYVVLAVGAVPGSYLTGWATDRFFGGRRAPVIAAMMVLLALLTVCYGWAAENSVPLTIILLMLIGFCVFGPQVLLVGSAPSDLAHRGNAAAAAGFVDFLGYLGAALGGLATGYYKEHEGWHVVIYIWAGWALAGAVTASLLWNATPRNDVVHVR
jgi:sugar phosphate permease